MRFEKFFRRSKVANNAFATFATFNLLKNSLDFINFRRSNVYKTFDLVKTGKIISSPDHKNFQSSVLISWNLTSWSFPNVLYWMVIVYWQSILHNVENSFFVFTYSFIFIQAEIICARQTNWPDISSEFNWLYYKYSNVKVGKSFNIFWMLGYFGDPHFLNNIFIICTWTQVYVTKPQSPADKKIII